MPEVSDSIDSGTDEQTTDSTESSSSGGDASLWESRFKGLQGKFGETQNQLKAEQAARAKAEADLEALRTGKVSAEEAAQAKVDQIARELEAERQARKVESLKVRFPETFDVFGDTAASFDEATLAASEARLGGGESPADGPTPRKHNESRAGSTGRKPESEKTAADIEAELLSTPVPW